MADYDLGRARGRIEIDSSDLTKLKTDSEKAASSFSSSMKKIGSTTTAAGKAMSLGLTLPIVGFGVASVKAFTETQAVTTQTQAAIKSTGGVANVSAKQIQNLASQIEHYSGQSDEAVRQGENMLLTFRNIRNEAGKGNDIFNQTTTVLADMSQVFGDDMSNGAIRLGKALNDPIRGVTALRRVGVAFTDQQTNQIKKLQESGNIMGAQKIVLAELTKEFGGSAKAFGTTAAGQFKIGKEKINDAMESIGKSIVKVAGPIMEKLADAIGKVMKWFNNLSPGMKNTIIIIGGIVAAIGPLLIIIGTLITAIGTIAPVAAAVFGAIISPIGLVIAAIVILTIVVIKNWTTIKKFILGAWDAIKRGSIVVFDAIKSAFLAVWNFIRPVVMLIVNLWIIEIKVMLAVWKVVWAAIKIVFNIVVDVISTGVKVMVTIFKVAWAVIKAIITIALILIIIQIKVMMAVWRAVWPIMKAVALAVWHAIMAVVHAFVAVFKAAMKILAPIAKAVFNAIKRVVMSAFNVIKAGVKILAKVFGVVFRAMAAVAKTIWHAISVAASTAFGVIKRVFNALKSAIMTGWNAIKNVGKSIWNVVVNAAKTAFNGLVTLWNNTVGAIAHGQTISAGPLHATLPDLRIEGFARGVKNYLGGLAVVGEKGPELVLLPKGASVLPNNVLREMATRPRFVSSPQGGGKTIITPGDGGSLKGVHVTIVDSNLGVVMHGVVTDEQNEEKQFNNGMARMRR